MLDPEQNTDDLQAVIIEKIVFIRIIGRGSFKISATLKQFITETANKEPVTSFILDLKDCIGMDSTFMGVLAGLSCRLQQSGHSLELINLSEKNKELLATLGVDRVITHYGHSHNHQVPENQSVSLPRQSDKKEMAETALQAHENLVRICEENRPRFKRVIEYLKADVDRLNG